MKTSVQVIYPYPSGLHGVVSYDDKAKKISVDFPVPDIEKRIKKYLDTKREFTIPESPAIDDFRTDTAYPKDNLTYWELALCELYTNTEVWVDWKTQE